MDEGDETGVVRVAVHLVLYGCAVRGPARPAPERPQQRLGERQQAGHGGERIARQAHQMAAGGEPGQQHGVAGAYGDTVHEQFGARAGEHGVDVVDGARGRTAGGEDQIGVGLGDRLVQRVRVVGDPPGVDHIGAERAQPGRDHRAERVADEAVVGQSADEQFVTEDQDVDGRAAGGEQFVVTGGGRQAEHGRGHHGSGGQELVAGAALLGAWADVLAVDHGAFGVEVAGGVGAGVLAADHGGGVGRDARAGGDAYSGAVGERGGGGVPGEYASRALGGLFRLRFPGAGSGHRPAVHGRGVEGGQVGESGQGLGEDVSQGLVERDAAGGGDGGATAGAGGDGTGVGPRRGAGAVPASTSVAGPAPAVDAPVARASAGVAVGCLANSASTSSTPSESSTSRS